MVKSMMHRFSLRILQFATIAAALNVSDVLHLTPNFNVSQALLAFDYVPPFAGVPLLTASDLCKYGTSGVIVQTNNSNVLYHTYGYFDPKGVFKVIASTNESVRVGQSNFTYQNPNPSQLGDANDPECDEHSFDSYFAKITEGYTADGYVQDIVDNDFGSDAGISGVSVKTPTSYNYDTHGIGYDDFKLCSCAHHGSIAAVCGTTSGDGPDSNPAMCNLLDGMQLQQ